MSSLESPVLSPLLAAGAMAHGDDDGGGWLTGNSVQDRPDWDPDWDQERWKEEWKKQWREQRRRSKQRRRQQQQGQGQEQRWPTVAGSALPGSSEPGEFELQPLVLDKGGRRPEPEPEPESDTDFSPSGGPSTSVRQAAQLHADRQASIGDASGEVVREWSQLYRMTPVVAGTCVEARGKKAQYEHYFKNKTDASAPTDDPETQPCGCVCQSAVARVTDDPWKWFTGVPLSLMWNSLRFFLVASAVHSIVRCHLQWYVGEDVDCTSMLETLVRLALVLNVAAAMQEMVETEKAESIAARAEADEAREKVQREADEARAAAQDTAYSEQAEHEAAVDNWNQGRARLQRKKETRTLKSFMRACVVGVKLVARPACAPAMVLTALGIFAWMPATYFVGSKIRNWDWADDFVAASLLEPDQLAANIDTMKKSETQGERAARQTEQLFFYGLGLSVELYCLLRLLRCWLEAQLRRLNALTHWDELSRAFWDDLYQQAFKKYDKDRDESITKQELEVSPPDENDDLENLYSFY